MKVAFIGDIVGSPGREMVQEHLPKLKKEHGIDFVVANYENTSHGFGLTLKNANELFAYGINALSGGNHTWDKMEIEKLLVDPRVLRPHNYPKEALGTGLGIYNVGEEKLAVLNLLGHFCMPHTDNAFRCAMETIEALREDAIFNIFIDFHAEATSEKRALLKLLEGKVSGIIGTHTHIGTDDFSITNGTAYLSDIGLSGCRDNIIGMDSTAPLKQFLTGVKARFDIPKKCKKMLQIAIMEFVEGECKSAYKLKIFDDGRVFRSDAFLD
ncbi:MAG: TIGR00282 family metallophosphoesterase [Sulfuricurvum sp.]